MKKTNSIFTVIGLLLFFLLCLVPNGQAQQATPVPYANQPAQLALSWTFTAASAPTGGFTVKGLNWWQLSFVPSGTVSACGVSLDSSAGSGFSTGGIINAGTIGSCAAAAIYSNSSATTPTLLGQLTPTITGSGSVTVTLLGYVNNPAAGGSIGGSVAVTNFPSTQAATQSGTWNVRNQDGAGNALTTNSTSTASKFALDFNVLSILGTAPTTPGFFDVKGADGNLFVRQPTGSNLHVQVDTAPTTPTQPAGFGTLVGFQQAVTASAVALTSNASHSFCVEALPSNTINIYVGPSGVTTATGTPLAPGQSACWSLSNTNLVYVIASATGASVAVTGV